MNAATGKGTAHDAASAAADIAASAASTLNDVAKSAAEAAAAVAGNIGSGAGKRNRSVADEVNMVRGALGATSRIVAQAASILEEEIAAGIVAARKVEERLIDVRQIRGTDAQEVMQRFRRDAHDVVDILIDLVNLATNSLSGLAQRVIRISEGGAGGAARPTGGGIPALDVGHPVRPGESVEVPLTLENDGDKPTENFRFQCSDLINPAGGRITGSYVTFAPTSIVIGAHSSAKITITVAVPEGTAAGVYSGVLQASQLEQLRAVLSVHIAA